MASHAMALTAEETALLRELTDGDRERAASRFIRTYQRFVYGIALRHLDGNRDDAADVAQETFIRALQALPRFKGESSIQTWLYRITVNTCLSYRKRWKRFVPLDGCVESGEELPSTLPLPDRELEDREFIDFFHGILAKLPPKQRETFYLRYVEGLSYEEIADILGTSVSGLKANYYHAIRKIAALLGRPISNGAQR
ncbi:MAG: RNA polymerase sigma factor [Chlorobi bacterium]|nr:RNA polymerase sigma factor [Chlorobiota bacterium]